MFMFFVVYGGMYAELPMEHNVELCELFFYSIYFYVFDFFGFKYPNLKL